MYKDGRTSCFTLDFIHFFHYCNNILRVLSMSIRIPVCNLILGHSLLLISLDKQDLKKAVNKIKYYIPCYSEQLVFAQYIHCKVFHLVERH